MGKQAELAALMKTHLPILREAGLVTVCENIIMQAHEYPSVLKCGRSENVPLSCSVNLSL